MAEELVLVNVSKAPATVNLPSGRPVIILPSYGVQGDHFGKYASAGVLVPLQAVPAGFAVLGISQPLTTEGVRPDNVSSTALGRATKRPVPVATHSKAAAVALAQKGEAATTEAAAAELGAKLPPATDRLEGLSVDDWCKRVRSVSDTTLGQQMKLAELKRLATFLGIESADLLKTKQELIAAVRVKVRA